MKRAISLLFILVLTSAAIACGSDSIATPAASTTTKSPNGTSAASAEPGAADGNYTVRIGFPSGTRDAKAPSGPDLFAVEQGIFDEEFGADNIKFEYTPFLAAGPAVNEALASGNLDVAVFADTAGLLGKASGGDTSLVAINEPSNPAWIVVAQDSDIQSLEQLRGRKVATIKATFPHRYLLEALAKAGLTEADIEFVNMTIPDSEQALKSGQIDATVSLGLFGPRILAQGFRAIDSTAETPNGLGVSVVVASNSFIAAHPGFFPRYFAAKQRAVDWANANYEAAIAALAAAGGSTPALVKQVYPGPTFNYAMDFTPEVLGRIKATAQFLVDAGLAKQAVDVDGWISKTVAYSAR